MTSETLSLPGAFCPTHPSVLDLVAELKESEEAPIVVGRLGSTDEGRRNSFSVSLKPGTVRAGVYHVLVGRSSSANRIVAPVAVRVGDDQ